MNINKYNIYLLFQVIIIFLPLPLVSVSFKNPKAQQFVSPLGGER